MEVSQLYTFIGASLKSERKKRNLTQEDLSELTGWTQPNISRYERGDPRSGIDSISKLILMAEAIGISPQNILLAYVGKKDAMRKDLVIDEYDSLPIVLHFSENDAETVVILNEDFRNDRELWKEIVKAIRGVNKTMAEAVDLFDPPAYGLYENEGPVTLLVVVDPYDGWDGRLNDWVFKKFDMDYKAIIIDRTGSIKLEGAKRIRKDLLLAEG